MPAIKARAATHPHENQLLAAFVELADTLVDNFDTIDFLHTLAGHALALLDLDAAAVILANAHGELLDIAASNEATRQLELSAITGNVSPGLDCFHQGTMLPDHRLDTMASLTRWPHYAHAATGLGLRRVAAVPLRLREQVIGALSLFHNQPGGLSLPQLRLAQALADTAAIGILQQRSTADQALLATQLEHALQARIVIEQAKGALATHHAIDTDTAFELMRAHARTHQQRLTDLARQILEGTANRSLFDPAR